MKAAATQHDQLVRNTQVWVAQTFYGQMLKQMRESPFKSDLMDGGRGGQAFQAQLDQKLAERMASSKAGDRLVRSIVKKLERIRQHHQQDGEQQQQKGTQDGSLDHVGATDYRA
jgi:Rod binding domain-containing protein